MMFIWKSVRSFKQHVADMKLFRQKHEDIANSRNSMIGNMPLRGDIEPVYSRGGSKIIITTRRKTKLVPIWKIELPRGVQN
jgi:hypothetical protein